MVLPGSEFPVVRDVARVQAGQPYSGAYFPQTSVLITNPPWKSDHHFFLLTLGQARRSAFPFLHPDSGGFEEKAVVLWIATGTLDIRAVGAWLWVSGSLVGGEREASTPRLYYHPSSQFKSRHGVGWGTLYQPTWVILWKEFGFVIQRHESFGKTYLSILHSNIFGNWKMRSPLSHPLPLTYPKVFVIQNRRRWI